MKLITLLLIFTIMTTGCSKKQEEPVNAIKYVDVGTDRIAYKISGSGFPILMCMGYSGTMDMWQPEVITRLSKHYQLIVFSRLSVMIQK